jgi:hypothetical protein
MLDNEKFYVSVANVFANLSFLTPEPEKKVCDKDNVEFFSIGFSKERKGKLYMRISKELLNYIHSTLSDGGEAEEETGKEVLNIVCGNFLSDVFSDKKSFKLFPPQKVDGVKEIKQADMKTEVYFEMGNAEFFVFLEENK